ncbi:MAG TPA: aldehyde dehydrogenase, partial [Actinobacteria bacterium]|nr:aldehyde dehydrogenase [Actinomycetota bacterium]
VLWYAGWADKYAQVLGNTNPVSGPFFNFSIPEPTGVVAAVAPADSSLLGLISVIAPIITSGNSVIVIASTASPIPAITLSECLATSDVIAGNINILTGDPAEIMPSLASHGDVNALDLTGITDPELQKALQIEAAGTVKRVRSAPVNPDWQATPSLSRLRAFTEVKTVWHPLGM